MFRPLSLVLLSILSFPHIAIANSGCVAFDIYWNLLAFGFNGKDYNAGTQDTWTSGQATDITTSGRPPFNGANTTCYLSEYINAIYVLGADSSNPSAIYIYDATAKSWSTQTVTTGNFNPASFDAILDHDTNVFYAYSKGDLYSLDMGLLKAANSTPVPWNDVQAVDFGTSDYRPVMAIAQNHVHFLNVPSLPDGSAKIFVIHFSYLQPQPQSYGNFPNTYGQATSFFQETGVQQEFAFIPSDGSATYVINVETNTTQTLKGPTIKDADATYFASTTALIQLSSSGTVSYLLYNSSSPATNTNTAWNVVSKLPSALSASATGTHATGTTASGHASATSGSKNGAVNNHVGLGSVLVVSLLMLTSTLCL
ncbi:hypothetical protein AX15_007951 [Amanita polypyramis BW_CC]|nr:hypothetical protein AX15_007951 [Amanita polypyramis BW_CC]